MIIIIEFAESAVRFDAGAWMNDAGELHVSIDEPANFGNAVVRGETMEAAGFAAGKRVGFEVDG